MSGKGGRSGPRRVRIAVLGLGHWGPHHVRIFSALPGSEVTALVDKDPARLAAAGSRLPGARLLRSAEPAFASGAVDAVVVATPTSTHFALVKAALERGKHVLCEKPLCLTSAEGAELVELARRRRRVLMVGHVFLFNAGIIKLKEMVDKGELGRLRYASAERTNLGPIRSDANVSYDLATHDISIFNWILGGTPECVSATGGAYLQPGLQDVVFATLRYPRNRMASLHVSWIDPKKSRKLVLVGSRRMVTWDDLELTTPIAIYDRGASVSPGQGGYGEYLRVTMWDGEVRMPRIEAKEPMKAQAERFLEAVRGGRVERSGGDFGVEVVRVLEGIDRSLALGGAPVRL